MTHFSSLTCFHDRKSTKRELNFHKNSKMYSTYLYVKQPVFFSVMTCRKLSFNQYKFK